jgi:hypothetical protein
VTDRLPARIEVSALLRQVQAEGGFGMIIARGDPDAGALMVVLCDRGADYRAYERMPSLGGRIWQCAKRHNAESPDEFPDWLKNAPRRTMICGLLNWISRAVNGSSD